MGMLNRREKPPADVLAALDPDERVLSWADTSGEDVVIATTLGLWWPGPAGRRRIAWQYVDKVVWQAEVMSVTEAEVEDDALLIERPAVHARITVPRDLPPVVRKRVEQNIVRTELVSVTGGAVRFVARKLPGRDGTMWWARLEPGTPDTASVRSAVRARLALLRGAGPVSGAEPGSAPPVDA